MMLQSRVSPLTVVSMREKPLLEVSVNLGPKHGLLTMGVFKDDTAGTVADRIIRESGAQFPSTQE